MNLLLLAGLSAATFGGGLLRGYTGFGGALLMAPFFTRLLGPIESVALISVMHVITAFQGVWQSVKLYDHSVVLPMLLSATMSVPIGVYLLGAIEPRHVKMSVAVIVIVLAIALGAGWRLGGSPNRTKSIVVGSVSGILNGFCGTGGPPAMLYLLSDKDSADTLRAGFILFFALLYPVTVVALMIGGAITYNSFIYALILSPINYLATEAGRRCFHRLNSRYFMPVCSVALCLAGMSMLMT